MSAFLLPNAGRGQEPSRVRLGWLLIYIAPFNAGIFPGPYRGYIDEFTS